MNSQFLIYVLQFTRMAFPHQSTCCGVVQTKPFFDAILPILCQLLEKSNNWQHRVGNCSPFSPNPTQEHACVDGSCSCWPQMLCLDARHWGYISSNFPGYPIDTTQVYHCIVVAKHCCLFLFRQMPQMRCILDRNDPAVCVCSPEWSLTTTHFR